MSEDDNVLTVTKAEEASFERGFKTWCENTAITLRKTLGLYPSSPLPPEQLAKHMGVTTIELEKVPGLDPETFEYLRSAKGDEWSAVTVHTGGKQIVIVNPRHSIARQSSNIMHELAHILRSHKPAQVYIYEGYHLREFDHLQENEANWFAGCLLLPRPALLLHRNVDLIDSARKFGVSKSLYNYRMNVSGVRRQYRTNA